MKLNQKLLGGIFLTGMVLTLVLAGCSDTNVLQTPAGTLTLQFQVNNSGSTEYEQGTFTVFSVTVRPLEVQAQQSLGGATIALLANEVRFIDLNASETSIDPANLPAGSFILENVNFFPPGKAPIELQNNDADPMAAACIDRKTLIPGTTGEKSIVSTAFLGQSLDRLTLHPNTLIQIPSGDTLNYSIGINSSLLIQAYKNAFTCSDVESTCRIVLGPSAPVPCVIGFNANQFLDELDSLDWVTF